jgi:hypothetical protein
MAALLAWGMKDNQFDTTGLWVYMLLTDRYFIVGTRWPDEAMGWFTTRYPSAAEAQARAITHTAYLEKGGDTMEHGPVGITVEDQTEWIEPWVGQDVPSALFDRLWDEAMVAGVTA